MKIGIDTHAAESEGEGNCTYIRNVVTALRTIKSDHEYVLFSIDADHDFYRIFAESPQFRVVKLRFSHPLLRIPISLARESLRENLDILHVQYIAPPIYRGKLVTTIHDLCFLHFPETFSRAEAFRLKHLIGFTARHSSKIITGSEYSKSDIAVNLPIPREKIAVIHHGISNRFAPQEKSESSSPILKRYGLKKPYILTVGRLNPRKNLSSLLRSFSDARRKASIPHQLVIAGKTDYKSQEIPLLIKQLGLGDAVRLTGFLPENDLPTVYREAEFFAYPSIFEGVGLPALEAMKAGIPVLTSNTTSLKEMVGNAGRLVNPFKQENITEGIIDLAVNADLREDLRKKGLARAALFTWERTAQKTLEIYEEVGY